MGEGDMKDHDNAQYVYNLRCEYRKLLEDSVNPRLFTLLNKRIHHMDVDDLKYKIGRMKGIIA